MNKLKEYKYLIIEDESEIRDFLLRILIDVYGIDSENIYEAENLEDASRSIEKYEPNIIILDLNIPADKGLEPDIINAYKIIEQAELFNFRQSEPKNRIKIIVISGSIEDEGVQKIIKHNRNVVFDFFDKGIISENPQDFKSEFIKKLEKAIEFEGYVSQIDYSLLRRTLMKDLQKIKPELWNKIDNQILQEFEKLNDKKSNEFVISKSIIGTCGEIVEDIIILLEGMNKKPDHQYDENEGRIRNRLIKFTGRVFKEKNPKTNELVFEITETEAKISRISCEYALFAYKLRSQALHSKEGDIFNNKWFFDYKFSKEDAAVSIDLLIPIVKDYIRFVNKTKKQS